jgi:hypothetical protein
VGGVNGPSRRYSAVPDRAPWWTEADQAELDVLIKALVDVAFVHRERCAVCIQEGSALCIPLCAAIETVLDWRWYRSLRSKAEWLRCCEEARAVA